MQVIAIWFLVFFFFSMFWGVFFVLLLVFLWCVFVAISLKYCIWNLCSWPFVVFLHHVVLFLFGLFFFTF